MSDMKKGVSMSTVDNDTGQRGRGRPPRRGRPAVKFSVLLDKDLYDLVCEDADRTSIPSARILNAIVRAYYEADYAALDLGPVPGQRTHVRVNRLPASWPQRPDVDDGEVRA